MDIKLSSYHRAILDRLIQACQKDERIIAAFLIGSYVKGKPDQHSDLDLFLVTTDESYDDFVTGLSTFVHLLGESLFIEDFDLPGILFLIFPDGSEVEISYTRKSQINQAFNGPFKVLLDKKNFIDNVTIKKHEFDQEEQKEKLRRLIMWFWHDFSHFVTAMGRNQLWWAHGQLEVLRSMCVGLARLQINFSDSEVEGEVYFKIEKAIPVEILSPLQDTFCPMEKDAMFKAGQVLVQFYEKHAKSLAMAHGIAYPYRLESVMVEKFKELQ